MHLWAAPAYSMGKSKRSFSTKKMGEPGPQTYRNEVRAHSPSWKMSKASKSNYATIQTPGPGTYNLKIQSNAKQNGVSFKGRPSSAMNTYGPGPGDYNPNSSMIIKKSPEHKIPKDKRDSSRSSSRIKQPGPTTYLTSTSQNWKSGVKFGKEDKLGWKLDTNPGPCTYEFADKELKLKRSVPRTSFGSAERIKSMRPESPGPGSYFIPSEFEANGSVKKGYKIPTSTKEDIIGKKLAPGPGAYDLSAQSILRASPAYTISGGPIIHNPINYSSTPGPTTYNIPDLDSKLGVIMGKSKKYSSPKNRNSPGPGLYNYQTQIGSLGPKYTIPSKHDDKPIAKSPGPGYYSPTKNQHIYSPLIKRETRQRHSLDGIDNPGPGFYNVNSLSSIGFTIGKEKRDPHKSETKPGPGQYDIQTTISNLPTYSVNGSIKFRKTK